MYHSTYVSPVLYTIYSILAHIRAVLVSVHPLSGPEIILKFVFNQCKTWIAIMPTPHFHPDLTGNALHVYARGYGSTVGQITEI